MGAYSTHEAIRLEEEVYDPIAYTAVLATGIRAYAVQFCGEYWVVWAKTASRAKGMVIKTAWDADHQFRVRFPSLRCRRWPALDGRVEESMDYWGFPGSRDYETGTYIMTPDPWRSPHSGADSGSADLSASGAPNRAPRSQAHRLLCERRRSCVAHGAPQPQRVDCGKDAK